MKTGTPHPANTRRATLRRSRVPAGHLAFRGSDGASPSTIFVEPQEQSRRFNEDEAVWRCFEVLRARRRWLRPGIPLSEETRDRLVWAEAERNSRETRYIGEGMP